MTALLWLRRDLRRYDHPALGAAHAASPDGVAVAFVLDPAFFDGAGPARQAWLAATLRALDESWGGRLTLRSGDPVEVVPALARELGAREVHVSSETEPHGSTRDARVRAALAEAGVGWVETGSPYAVTPGRVRTAAGHGYRVFTPFSRAWRAHGWRSPADAPEGVRLVAPGSDADAWARLDSAHARPGAPDLPPAGEEAALGRWRAFLDEGMAGYAEHRDRPDLTGTSALSPYLKFGVVHPRTLLADLERHRELVGDERSVERFATELAWREFYADVLFHHPHALWADLDDTLAGLAYDPDPAHVDAWRQGRTGYPLVDAAQRQLLSAGWVHNRARMVTASFLTKDLHAWWPVGAQHFLDHLIDGDLASNNLSWQWVAGTGTDAAPFVRVFNPTRQGLRFDPDGAYVRRWVPELRHLPGPAVHEPWNHPDGYAHGYPQRIVDHDAERRVALGRYEERRTTG